MGRYANGDSAAFDEIFRRYESRAFGYFVSRTRSPDRSRDLYQELFLRVHRARHEYDPTRAFVPWFFQIAHRLVIDDERRAYRSREVSLAESDARVPHSVSDGVADRDQLAELLEGLSEDERFVLVATKVEGVGYAVLAERLGKSVDAVRKMASRAMLRLRAGASHLPHTG